MILRLLSDVQDQRFQHAVTPLRRRVRMLRILADHHCRNTTDCEDTSSNHQPSPPLAPRSRSGIGSRTSPGARVRFGGCRSGICARRGCIDGRRLRLASRCLYVRRKTPLRCYVPRNGSCLAATCSARPRRCRSAASAEQRGEGVQRRHLSHVRGLGYEWERWQAKGGRTAPDC
jgi:hypothetical protein